MIIKTIQMDSCMSLLPSYINRWWHHRLMFWKDLPPHRGIWGPPLGAGWGGQSGCLPTRHASFRSSEYLRVPPQACLPPLTNKGRIYNILHGNIWFIVIKIFFFLIFHLKWFHFGPVLCLPQSPPPYSFGLLEIVKQRSEDPLPIANNPG